MASKHKTDGGIVETIKTGKTQADRWLDLYNGAWNHSLTPLYEASSL